jgi:alpha-glucoside transport system substrate-binding protein
MRPHQLARRLRGTPVLLISACAALTLAGCSTGGQPDETGQPEQTKTIQVVGVWTGTEEAAFKKVLSKFKNETGYTAVYTGSRDIDQLVKAQVDNGTPPDVALVANPSELANYFTQGKVLPLRSGLDKNYGPAWRQWVETSTSGSRKQFAIVYKADLKSLIWYNRKKILPPLKPNGRTPPTWPQITAQVTAGKSPWCMGLGANSSSGFPGTDWISEIMLAKYGPGPYEEWVSGSTHWDSAVLTDAFRTWGGVLDGVRGGAASALLNNFNTAGRPMFASPAGCSLDNEGSFIPGVYSSSKPTSSLKSGTDYDFFPFPEIKPQPAPAYEVGGTFASRFTDAAGANKLIEFLADTRSQKLFARDYGQFSVNKDVSLADYSGSVNQHLASIIKQSDPTVTLCIGASDLLSPTMTAAFYQAVLTFAASMHDQSTAPARATALKKILSQLQTVSAEPTSKAVPFRQACHTGQ